MRTLWQRMIAHVTLHPSLYGPALPPVLLFVFAHVVVVPIMVVLKMNGVSAGHTLFATVLVWAVLGFLPLLGMSYLSSFFVARPLSHLLRERFPHWSATRSETLSAAAYAVGLGAGMLVLIRPASLAGGLILLGCCLAAGLVYRALYRRVATTAEPPAAN